MKKLSRDDCADLIGEGIHAGLRKACESRESAQAWLAIQHMEDWDMAVMFAVDGIHSMGCEIVELVDGNDSAAATEPSQAVNSSAEREV